MYYRKAEEILKGTQRSSRGSSENQVRPLSSEHMRVSVYDKLGKVREIRNCTALERYVWLLLMSGSLTF